MTASKSENNQESANQALPFILFVGAGSLFFFAGIFFGVFSRGVVNASFILLAVWAAIGGVFFRSILLKCLPPKLYLLGLALYLGACLLSSAFSVNPARSFLQLGNISFLLFACLSVWMVLSFTAGAPLAAAPYCYGAGLFVWLAISL